MNPWYNSQSMIAYIIGRSIKLGHPIHISLKQGLSTLNCLLEPFQDKMLTYDDVKDLIPYCDITNQDLIDFPLDEVVYENYIYATFPNEAPFYWHKCVQDKAEENSAEKNNDEKNNDKIKTNEINNEISIELAREILFYKEIQSAKKNQSKKDSIMWFFFNVPTHPFEIFLRQANNRRSGRKINQLGSNLIT